MNDFDFTLTGRKFNENSFGCILYQFKFKIYYHYKLHTIKRLLTIYLEIFSLKWDFVKFYKIMQYSVKHKLLEYY